MPVPQLTSVPATQTIVMTKIVMCHSEEENSPRTLTGTAVESQLGEMQFGL